MTKSPILVSNEFQLVTEGADGPKWLHLPSGRTLPYVAGGDGPTDDDNPDDNPDNNDDGDDVDPEQARLNRVAAKSAARAARRREREIAEQLGCSIEEAKQVLAAARERDAANLTEAEQAAAAAKADREAAARELAEAKRERFAARVEAELTRAGVTSPNRVARLLDLDPDDDPDTDDIAAAIADLRSDLPGLFTAVGDENPPRPVDSTTRRRPPRGPSRQPTIHDRARERARAMAKARGITLDD